MCGTTRPALVFGEGAMKRKDALCWLRGCKIKELCVQVILRLKKIASRSIPSRIDLVSYEAIGFNYQSI